MMILKGYIFVIEDTMQNGIKRCNFIFKSERFVKIDHSTGKCVTPYKLNHVSY